MNENDELPGMLAVAKGVAEQKWPHTMDAQVWAAEFVKHCSPSPPEDVMLGWFANAIMAGYDTAQARAQRAEAVATDETRNLILWNDTRIRQLLQKLPVRDLDELLARNSAFLATGNPLGSSGMNPLRPVKSP